ncbi:hypothetical protein Acr_15g0017610 [Actinidia rufa]|uniref:Uncharacterized protein n=1 Tax=Actinidia rufa TaxID=165716 RepID=A0A7J0FWU2_9ERIC|nr:hypothetical protein Acr_15g0017610 [Actinidia rufa]
MPKSLSNLSKLKVFKGFFTGDAKHNKPSCALDNLSKLQRLRKLNIYRSVIDFPTERHLSALQQFKALHKLTISWGGCSFLAAEIGPSMFPWDETTQLAEVIDQARPAQVKLLQQWRTRRTSSSLVLGSSPSSTQDDCCMSAVYEQSL